MKIRFNTTHRRDLADEIGNIVGAIPNYQKLPTFAYKIGEYILDREGTLHIPDTVDSAAIDDLMEHLSNLGFIGESDQECYKLIISTPRNMLADLGMSSIKQVIENKKSLFITVDLFEREIIEDDKGDKLVIDTDTSAKLPNGFFISTPVGRYNPDWVIAFYKGNIKHIYFVAETKGSMSSMQLRLIEESKIHCAKEHFRAISNSDVVYDVVDSYQSLLDKVMK